jgi:hypothetical protein
MVIWACGLLSNPAKVPKFQYRVWLCSMDQKFHDNDEKTQKFRFWDLAIIWPKSQNSNIRHNGILSIGNFMLMINNHFALFQLHSYLSKIKKMCSLFIYLGIKSHKTSKFAIIFFASETNTFHISYVESKKKQFNLLKFSRLRRTLILRFVSFYATMCHCDKRLCLYPTGPERNQSGSEAELACNSTKFPIYFI